MNLQALCTRREQKQGQVTQAPPGHILVEYAGPSVRPDRPSDYGWVPVSELLRFEPNVQAIVASQSASIGPHQQAFQQAMAAVERFLQQEIHEECSTLERKLLDAVRRIPSKPQAPFQLFASDRVPILAKTAQESGHAFSAENLQLQLMDEFSKLPETTLHGLKQTGDGEFQATMRDALTFVKQVWQQVITPKAFRHDYDVTLTAGRSYLRMCEQAQQAPHKELVPVIHLTLHGAEVAHGTAASTGVGGQAPPVALATGGCGVPAVQPAAPLRLPPEDLYVMVMCNSVTGRLHPLSCRVEANGKEMSATQFEQFSGCASAKKWRASLKVVPGSCPECPEGSAPMQVGRWFDIMGWATGASRSKARKT